MIIGILTVILVPESNSYSKTFTFSKLESIKQQQKRPPHALKKNSATTHGIFSANTLLPPYETTFWWQLFPTTGLRPEKPFWPSPYPYIPHTFTLWELAPSLGKGITVTLIDTGIFGSTFSTPSYQFVKHPDILIAGDFLREPHSLCPYDKQASNPFENLAAFVLNHTQKKLQNPSAIHKALAQWIVEYALYTTTIGLDTYLQHNGNSDLFENNILFFLSKKKLLSIEGKRVKNELLHGTHGFSHFTAVTLESGDKAIAQFIPTPSSLPSHLTDHATHTASIIGARLTKPRKATPLTSIAIQQLLEQDTGLCGLAPACTLRVIKAVREAYDTTTDVTHVTHALRLATEYHTDIVNLSLKLDDAIDPHDQRFEALEKKLASFPYACCAAGNEGTKKPGRLSYPARFKNVPFSVGSFRCLYDKETDTYSCPLSSFSQYEKGKGPSFVAPGESILGCSYAHVKKEPLYALKSGTSCSAAHVSGSLALILGEFKNDFSHQQILLVCQSSCFKLHATLEWKEHVTYGVLDIRTALFTLHVLKKIKGMLSHLIFEKNFLSILNALHKELFETPNTYAKEHGIAHSFKESFIDYYNVARHITFTAKDPVSLKKAINNTASKVIDNNSFLYDS